MNAGTASEANPCAAPLEALAPALPLGVAYSAGADSTALLLAACTRWPGQIQALHVHHGLQAAADAFEAHGAARCEQLGVPFRSARVDARHASGQSPEDAARQARYRALADLARAHGLQCVLLAQHADDQVETLLIALGRGAGLPGLAGMPADFERHGMRFLRPLLQVPGAAIRRWLADLGESFMEDPTNEDLAFTRNRVRHLLLPALEATFPAFRDTFARSARHAAQGQALLEAMAADDLAAMAGEPVIALLRALPRARQANLLRYWLRQAHGAAASAAQLEELLNQVADCATRGHAIRLKIGAGFVLRAGARLVFQGPVEGGGTDGR